MNKNIKYRTNWLSRQSLQENIEFFNEPAKTRLRMAFEKQDDYGDKHRGGNYFDNTCLFIACDHPKAERLLLCGRKYNGIPFTSCRQWRLCSRCAAYEKKKTLNRFIDNFYLHEFVHLTISFESFVTFKGAGSIVHLKRNWDLIKVAVQNLLKDKLILGAHYVEEIFVQGVNPVRVNPHAHCILHIDHWMELQREQVEERFKEAQDEIGATTKYSVLLKEVEDVEYFKNVASYLTKPIDIKESYEKFINDAGGNLRAITRGNRNLADFLITWTAQTKGRKARNSFGSMHPNCSEYIGVKKPKGKSWSRNKSSHDLARNKVHPLLFPREDAELKAS